MTDERELSVEAAMKLSPLATYEGGETCKGCAAVATKHGEFFRCCRCGGVFCLQCAEAHNRVTDCEPASERMDPETIDVILENRTLRAELAANAATIAAQAADLLDAAMLIRRLAHRCPGLAVAHQATDWLKRKGLQGSILRETEDSNG